MHRCLALLCLLTIRSVFADQTSCKYGEFDLAKLYWQTGVASSGFEYVTGPDKIVFRLCDAVNAVTLQSNGTTHVIGIRNATTNLPAFTPAASGGFSLTYAGETCPSQNEVYSVTIYFRCGKSLGRPVLLESEDKCNYVFEWSTVAACTRKPASGIKCYAVDSGKNLRDLDALVTGNPWPVLGTYDNERMFISLCQPHPVNGVVSTAAVYSERSDGSIDTVYGEYTAQTLMLGFAAGTGSLFLHVRNQTASEACPNGTDASIDFQCPVSGQSLGPTLLDTSLSSKCSLQIAWKTEHACPVELYSNHSCQLSLPNGMMFDLSSLQGDNNHQEKDFMYSFGICGQSVQCGSGQASVCQRSGSSTTGPGHSLGKGDGTLRFANGQLSLTYTGGDHCRDSYSRSTVIMFFCDHQDHGPMNITEDDCSYMVQWGTSLACLSDSRFDRCYAQDGTDSMEIYSLAKTDSNWEAVVDPSLDMRLFINLCHNINKVGDAANCDGTASVCSKATKGESVLNRGTFMKPLVYSGGVTYVHFVNGSHCPAGAYYETKLAIYCSPGRPSSSPLLVSSSGSACLLELEWHTSLGCSLQRKTGHDCRIDDERSGLHIDLSPLSGLDYPVAQLGSSNKYTVHVCGPLQNGQGNCNGSAVCQDVVGGHKYSLGKPTKAVTLYDHRLQMLFLNGDLYNDGYSRASIMEFICDYNVTGLGTPEFTDEHNHTYWFRWNTPHACSSPPQSRCRITDNNGRQYDLSSLFRSPAQEYWHISMPNPKSPASQVRVLLNVCGPVLDSNCSATAGVCAGAAFANMGQTASVRHDTSLSLLYENGGACYQHSDKNYSTEIYLMCNKDSGATQPAFMSYDHRECKFHLNWATEAACALEGTGGSSNCTIRDPLSDFLYNLTSLNTSLSYEGAETGNYQVNICGQLSSCGSTTTDVAVCYRDQVYGLHSKSTLRLAADGAVEMSIKTSGSMETLVHFQCDRHLAAPSLLPSSLLGGVLHLNIHTNAVCKPLHAISCNPVYGGKLYDFSSLSRKDGANWVVRGTNGEEYYLNVCDTLQRSQDQRAVNCPGGGISACMFDGSKYVSLGYMHSDVVMTGPTSAVLHYEEGQQCGSGSDVYSVKIQFDCSDQSQGPEYLGLHGCEKQFRWRTSLACSGKPNSTSSGDCTVLINSEEFSVKSLGSQVFHVVDPTDKSTYHIRVCGQDPAAPGCSGSVCQTPKGQARSSVIGDKNTTLVYNSEIDRFRMQYYSEAGVLRAVVHFECSETEGMGPMHHSGDTLYFAVNTPLVCRDESIECSYQGLDFSSLLLPDKNYLAVGAPQGEKVILNVCRRLRATEDTTGCAGNSAVCKVLANKAVSLGVVNLTPVRGFGLDYIVMQFDNGDICDAKTGQRYRTTIQMLCDREDEIYDPPRYEEFGDPCHYQFLWHTKAACSANDSSVIGHNCTIPGRFDLSGLRGTYTVSAKHEDTNSAYTYELKLCGGKSDDPPICGNSTAGGCQTSRDGAKFITGMNSERVYLHQGHPRMRLKGGAPCNGGGRRSTVIDIVCSKESREPSFDGEDECRYFFTMYSPLACENEFPCSVAGDGNIDLTPLMSSSHYLVKGESAEPSFFLNLCQPVMSGACPTGSAACMVYDNGTQVNFGARMNKPKYNADTKTVELGYISSQWAAGAYDNRTGKHCSLLSAIIKLQCGPKYSMGPGAIQLMRSTGCEFDFLWETSAVCPVGSTAGKDPCVVTDQATGVTISMKDFGRTQYSVTNGIFSMCGAVNSTSGECKGSGVCYNGLSYGAASSVHATQDNGLIYVRYTDGSPCPGSPGTKLKTTILLICDQSIEFQAEAHTTDSCLLEITVRSKYGCPYVIGNCSISHGSNIVDLALLSKKTGWWNTADENGSFFFNLCSDQADPLPVNGCPSGMAVCSRNGASASPVALGKVTPYQVSYSSHESGLIAVDYNAGGNKASIHLKCGPTFGTPVFASRYGGQKWASYVFNWTTLVACLETKQKAAWVKDEGVCNENICFTGVNELLQGVYSTESGEYKYLISLEEPLSESLTSGDCLDGVAACQMKPNDQSFVRPLGYAKNRQFNIYADNALVVNFTYDGEKRKCGTLDPYVYASVHLRCNESASEPRLYFLYESKRCDYIFELHSLGACSKSMRKAAPSTGSSGMSSAAVAGLVVGLICVILVVVVGVLLYRRRKRGGAVYRSLTSGDAGDGYGTRGADDNLLVNIDEDDEDTILAINPDASSSRYTPARRSGYDSDVDLIL